MTTRAFLLVAFLLWPLPGLAQSRSEPTIDPHAVLRAMETAFTSVADRVMPSVVNVSTVSKRAGGPGVEAPERFKEFFGEEFYERFFKRRPREESRASGSGVIVDPNGYILTNNHVIENAQEIIVRLSDARKFTATLVGSDPKTDLAVLKVEGTTPLPAADLGDSENLRVGQWAIAIGNPFGLDRTVTVGIISATARTRVGLTTYENFIQTDASINPGNSGGPLLNLDGRVIGVNTAIVASGQGIGFAIPINMAKEVMRQLITRGRVVRGWLGIVIQDVNDQLAQSFGVREKDGVLVSDVMRGSPAEAAGLRPGDVVVGFADTAIKEVPDLQRRVAAMTPGTSAEMKVMRDGAATTVKVVIGEMPSDKPIAAAAQGDDAWGLTVEALTTETARRLNVPVSSGALVTDVLSGGAADRAGLRRGDIILEIDRRPIRDGESVWPALRAVKPGESVPIYVHRTSGGGRNEYLVLQRPDKP
jgi:Do/DeqQ family serine protease